jgi:polyhydroxyalkanoate synthase subunit PhaC
LLAALRKEIQRNAVRARNGIKYAAGSEFAPVHPTPSDVIWRDGKAELRHYRRTSPPRLRQPVVALIGLMGQSYVFDLYKGGSIVEMLMDWGFDAYVLDWGVADELDAGNTLETYLRRYLPAALATVCETSDSQDVNVLAYCMGGLMVVQGLAAEMPLPIRNLVTLGSPFDWTDMGATNDLIREGKVDPEELLDEAGNLPGPVMVQAFKRLKPTADLVNYANLWQNLWNDQYVEGFQAIGRFLTSHGPMPGGAYRQVVQQWIKDNAFWTDQLRFNGRPASLSNVRCPVLAVVAEKDDIAPVESTAAVVDALPNAPVELLRVDAGHVSMFAGRQAVKDVMPRIFQWLEDHSEETA